MVARKHHQHKLYVHNKPICASFNRSCSGGLFLHLFFRKRFSSQRIFILVITVFLIIFEVSRIVWRYFYLKHNAMDSSFVEITDLNFSTLAVWLTILISLITFFYKKTENKKVPFLHFIYSVASLICFISLIYPTSLNSNFEFYHCVNLSFALSLSLVILLGVSLACSGWLNVTKLSDSWNGIVSLLAFGTICLILGKTLGGSSNLLFSDYFPLFNNIGMNVPCPFHYVILGLFMFIFQQIIYTPFKIYNHYKRKI